MERDGGRTYQPAPRFAPEITYEDFYPTYDWAQDSDGHILLIEIPGFTKENVTVQLDNFGNVTVAGQIRVSDSRYRRFKQVFGVPEDVNYERISARFDSGLLYIILPKISPAVMAEQRERGEGGGKAEQKQKDKSQPPEEKNEGIRKRAGGQDSQERAKEETREKVGSEEKRNTIKQEGETPGGKREKVGEEAQNNRDTIEGKRERKQEKTEEIGRTRQAKGKKRVKFGEETIDKGQEMRQSVTKDGEFMEEQGKGVGRKEETEQRSDILDREEAEKEKIEGEGEEPKEKKREKIDAQEGVKEDRTLGAGEIGAAKREVVQGRRVEGKEKESWDREKESVAGGNRTREDAEGSTETRDEPVDAGMGLRRIWESAGWRHGLESDTVGEILGIMKKNKVAVASALIALSAGLYLSHRFKTAGA